MEQIDKQNKKEAQQLLRKPIILYCLEQPKSPCWLGLFQTWKFLIWKC